MKMFTWIIFFVLILIAVAHFAPNTYDSGREWIVGKISGTINPGVANVVDNVVDITTQTTIEEESNNGLQ